MSGTDARKLHSTIPAIPQARLGEERQLLRPFPSLRPPLRRGERRPVDELATAPIRSALYSVTRELIGRDFDVVFTDGEVLPVEHRGELVAQHRLIAPGEVSIIAKHYGGPHRGPSRAVGGSVPARSGRRGNHRLGNELASSVSLKAARGRDALIAALERAVLFRRGACGSALRRSAITVHQGSGDGSGLDPSRCGPP
jgi:hypothetical protein